MVTVMDQFVKFRFFSPNAAEVEIVGDFTGWRSGQIHMTKGEAGFWTAELPLPQGIFHFRYLVDGEWYTDDTTCSVNDGPFGTDSVLWVLPHNLTHAQQNQVKKRMIRSFDARIGLPAPQMAPLQTTCGINRN